MRTIVTLTCCALLGLLLVGNAQAAPLLHYRVVGSYPHDASGFTEGLAICNGDLVESDGLYGHSRLVIRSLHTGRLLAKHALPASLFGEGVTCANGELIQLTWRAGLAYTYDFALNPLGTLNYAGEGWGLAFDGQRLIESDGSAKLRFFRPADFSMLGSITVRDAAGPVTQLNELEWAKGRIYANIWYSNRIAVIDPRSGKVTAWIDCTRLLKRFKRGPDWPSGNVLNGIAYDPESGHLFVTGKRWPKLFELAVDGLSAAPGKAQTATATPQ